VLTLGIDPLEARRAVFDRCADRVRSQGKGVRGAPRTLRWFREPIEEHWQLVLADRALREADDRAELRDGVRPERGGRGGSASAASSTDDAAVFAQLAAEAAARATTSLPSRPRRPRRWPMADARSSSRGFTRAGDLVDTDIPVASEQLKSEVAMALSRFASTYGGQRAKRAASWSTSSASRSPVSGSAPSSSPRPPRA
jgi:hypothetical protein